MSVFPVNGMAVFLILCVRDVKTAQIKGFWIVQLAAMLPQSFERRWNATLDVLG